MRLTLQEGHSAVEWRESDAMDSTRKPREVVRERVLARQPMPGSVEPVLLATSGSGQGTEAARGMRARQAARGMRAG